MAITEANEDYVKFNGSDEKKFCEWAIKTKAIRAREAWVKVLTEDLKLDQKSVVHADKKAVMMNDLAYHYLVMSCTNKAFSMSRWHKIQKKIAMEERHGKNCVVNTRMFP